MSNQPLTDKSPQFEYYSNIRHYRPMPSERTALDEKLDTFQSLLSVKNSLYVAIDDQYQKFTFHGSQSIREASNAVFFDLMMIAQILQEKIEQEFQLLSEFIQAQQPQNQGGEQ
ncbi:hypothetical protein [Lonepinella sp. BR2357]|uniref:hypothetical protein n=1 Tax=Lonepinella sp. BR2357 TaxID=3434549 RepID=UPI003F6E23D1